MSTLFSFYQKQILLVLETNHTYQTEGQSPLEFSHLYLFFFYHIKTKLQNRDEGGYEAQSGGNPMGRPISYPRHTTFTFRVINDLKQKLRNLVHSLCSHKQT